MLRSFVRAALLAASFSFTTVVASAQTMKDIVTKPEMPLTFMGLDFSAARYYGDHGTVSPREMKALFTKMDELMVNEAEKYDIAKAFHHEQARYNISFAESVNAQIDSTAIRVVGTTERIALTPAKIEGMVKNYAYPIGSSGTGVVFVMEALDKPKELTVFWITFVDLATKRMIYTEKIAGNAGGFGFRNHWAGGIYNALKTIKSTNYANWKRRFAKG